MKIEVASLRAVNCGSLQDVLIDFTDGQGNVRPVTLLAGANGSGKTTVLELIVGLAELLNPSATPPYNLFERVGYVQLELNINNKALSLFYSFNDYEPNETLSERYTGYVFDPKTTPPFKLQTASSSEPFIAHIHNKIVSKEREFNQSNAEKTLLPCFLYFPYLRYLRGFSGQQLNKEQIKYEWVYRYEPVKNYHGSLDSYLIWLEYAEPEVFASVQSFLNGIYSDRKQFSIDRRNLRGVVTTQSGGKHGLGELSSGEQNLLILLLEIRRRVTPGSVVLIDELENSLHPAFQHRLAQGLLQLQRETPFQLIATTHAEAFIDIFGTSSVRFLPSRSVSAE